MPASNDTVRSPAEGKDAPDPLLGQQIRDFRIIECIGRGGMGAVYKAVHVLLDEPRALKVIRGDVFLSVPQAAARFQREARIAIRLRHPNLVLIHDFFIEAGSHFLVMEYVVGESLSHRLRRAGPLPVDEACRIAIQCCHGLAHAHDLGIIHRDLSPGNVMLTPSATGPQAKIIDFGIARVVHSSDDTATSTEDVTLTRVGDFLGKPRYVSPEQAGRLRSGEHLDQRSDLYSLGLIFYEMLTADLPFHADTAFGYLSLHLTEPPEPPSKRHPKLRIPKELERVIMRCLEKDRDRRPPDARALAAAIERAVGSRKGAATPAAIRSTRGPDDPTPLIEPRRNPPPPRERAARGEQRAPETRRRRVPWPLASAVALTSIALGAGGYFAWRELAPDASSSATESRLAADSPAMPEPVAPEIESQAELSAPETVAVAPMTDLPMDVADPDPARVEPPTSPTPESVVSVASEPEPAPALSPPIPDPALAPELARTVPAEPENPPALVPAEPVPVPAAEPVTVAAKPEPAPVKPTLTPGAPPARVISPAPVPAPAPRRTARTEPPHSAVREPAKAAPAAPFASAAEMRAAYDDAAAFEASHDARAAIQRWKEFRARTPSHGFDELARRRITELSLTQLRQIK